MANSYDAHRDSMYDAYTSSGSGDGTMRQLGDVGLYESIVTQQLGRRLFALPTDPIENTPSDFLIIREGQNERTVTFNRMQRNALVSVVFDVNLDEMYSREITDLHITKHTQPVLPFSRTATPITQEYGLHRPRRDNSLGLISIRRLVHDVERFQSHHHTKHKS